MEPQADFYPYASVVKLTALPPTGTYFSSWSGDASGTNNPLRFGVTKSNQNVTAQFGTLSAGEFSLTVVEDGKGHLITAPQATRYASGQVVSLTAMPEAMQEFISWSGDATGMQNPLTLTMNQSRTITAHFTKRPRLAIGSCASGISEGGFRLVMLGEFGEQYVIEGTTNFVEWVPFVTVTNTFGIVQTLDTNAANLPLRFYRAVR